ncbi:hypothetical protein [Wolbachia endosymbiont of Drosophila subpulchrella]|nr:hypothetical protein [Wolbachia endosymbiont of Drosophila subpulchrella]
MMRSQLRIRLRIQEIRSKKRKRMMNLPEKHLKSAKTGLRRQKMMLKRQ